MQKLILWLVTASMVLPGCFSRNDRDSAKQDLSDNELDARWSEVKQATALIREGDLLLRCGNDQTSATLRDFSHKDKTFSHSGIALRVDGEIYVYHNMAGNLNPDEVVRKDKVDSFFNPANNVAIGIYRYDMKEDEVQRMRDTILKYYDQKLLFDMNFDLETDDRMYCAEMLAKAITRASNQRIQFPLSMVNDDLRKKYTKLALRNKVIPSVKAAEQREYLAIDDLYLNPFCKKVYTKKFEENTGTFFIPSPETDSIGKN